MDFKKSAGVFELVVVDSMAVVVEVKEEYNNKMKNEEPKHPPKKNEKQKNERKKKLKKKRV